MCKDAHIASLAVIVKNCYKCLSSNLKADLHLILTLKRKGNNQVVRQISDNSKKPAAHLQIFCTVLLM